MDGLEASDQELFILSLLGRKTKQKVNHIHTQHDALESVSWSVYVMSYVFYLLLQQTDDLPLTVHHLTVEVDDYPGKTLCIRHKRTSTWAQINTDCGPHCCSSVCALTERCQRPQTETEGFPPGRRELWPAQRIWDYLFPVVASSVFLPGTLSWAHGTDHMMRRVWYWQHERPNCQVLMLWDVNITKQINTITTGKLCVHVKVFVCALVVQIWPFSHILETHIVKWNTPNSIRFIDFIHISRWSSVLLML